MRWRPGVSTAVGAAVLATYAALLTVAAIGRDPAMGVADDADVGIAADPGVGIADTHPHMVDDLDPDPVHGETAAALVDAWARSRTAEYRATGTWRRTSASTGAQRSESVEIVQRAHERVERRGGVVVRGWTADGPYTCLPDTADPEGGPECRDDDLALDLDGWRAADRRAFEALVAGPDRRYAVVRASGTDGTACFDVLPIVQVRGPSLFGNGATICFDDVTGALASVVTTHGDVTDELVLDRVEPVGVGERERGERGREPAMGSAGGDAFGGSPTSLGPRSLAGGVRAPSVFQDLRPVRPGP